MKLKYHSLINIFIINLVCFFISNNYSYAQQLTEIKITRTNNLGLLPFIAENQGFFAEAGISLKVLNLQTGKMAMDSLISGDSEIATIVDSNVSFVGFSENDIKVIAVLGKKYDDDVYFKKNSGIKTPEDLKGKKIGYIPATTCHYTLNTFLKTHNIKWDEIKPVVINPLSINSALRQGAIDAVSIWQPYGFYIKKEFGDSVGSFDESYKKEPTYILLATTGKYLEKNKVLVKKFIDVLKATETRYNQDKNKFLSAYAPEVNIPNEIMPIIFEKIIFKVTEASNNNEITKQLNDIGSWAIESQENFKGMKLPDYSKMIAGDLF